MICKECQRPFSEEKAFNLHLRSHKLKMVDYYYKHFPRKDLYTGEFIVFKSKDFYFEHDFNNKINMRRWLETLSHDDARIYLRDLLIRRIEQKHLRYAPTQVEMRSWSSTPGIVTYKKYFPDYYALCAELGLKVKLTYAVKPPQEQVLYSLRKTMYHILVDTREQKPLPLDYPIQLKKLDFGDYSFEHSDIYVERKSLNDLINTISGDIDRFKREIERAKQSGKYLIVLVEAPFEDALGFNKLQSISKYTRVSPEFIFFRIRELCQTYNNIQFLFVRGRNESARVMKKIFFSYDVCKLIDCQLAYDEKLL